jgi:hypothetical protein
MGKSRLEPIFEIVGRRRIVKRERVNTMPASTTTVSNLILSLVSLLLLTTQLVASFQLTNGFPGRTLCNSHQPRSHLTLSATVTTATDTTTRDPFADINVSKIGQWEELHGNYLLKPPLDDGPPRALIHFLGGALVGASPHISYRYMLERLAAEGYLVVATPYELSFDHLATCDIVISRFERIAGHLARKYGALPVVGVGHSCGALLQVLITSLFQDTPRAANALLSFNNKPVSEAIPLFEEVFAPLFTYIAAVNDTTRPSGSEILKVSLQMAQTAAIGELPSDEMISKVLKLLTPPGISNGGAPSTDDHPLQIPQHLRDTFTTLTAPSTAALSNAGVVPLTLNVLKALEQIPMLVDEVAYGARDFVPPPAQVRQAARRSYRARRTLVIRYSDDPLDESDELEEILEAAGQIAAMKRPLSTDVFGVQRRDLPGGHAAPLIAPPLDLATRAQDILGADAAREALRYTEAEETVQELVRWLEEANL